MIQAARNRVFHPRDAALQRTRQRRAQSSVVSLLAAATLVACGLDETRRCPGAEAGTLAIKNQADLDTASRYVCAQNLQIEGSELAYIDALTGLRKVWGWVSIRGNGTLRDLNGLRGLEQIGLSLRIEDNPALSSIQGLGHLSALGSEDAVEIDDEGTSPLLALSLRNDDTLRSLAGLEQLSRIEGDVRIEGNDSLTSLTGFSRLAEVTGSLRLSQNYGLVDLDGLESLDRVGGSLDLRELQLLHNTNSLESLAEVGGDLTIRAAAQLATMALPQLETVGGAFSLESLASLKTLELPTLRRATLLELTELPGLESIAPLSRLQRLPEGWVMQELPQLRTVGDLPELEELGDLSFWSVGELGSLPSMPRLTVIEGRCEFVSLPALTRLDGFETLTEVTGALRISSNSALSSIDWSALRLVRDNLHVENNAVLPAAEAQAFAEEVVVGGKTSICGNADDSACVAP